MREEGLVLGARTRSATCEVKDVGIRVYDAGYRVSVWRV